MKTAVLLNQLKREATASPAKAGTLGLLTVVALYFVVPLIWSMVAGDSKPTSSPAVASNPNPTQSSPTPTEANPSDVPSLPYAWQDLASAIDTDARTAQVATHPQRRSPFSEFVASGNEQADSSKKTAPAVVEQTPEQLGFQLTSTIVGKTRSVALINGKAYRFSPQSSPAVWIKLDKANSDYAFQLVDVRDNMVVLERDGKRYPLRIKQPSLEDLGTIQIE